MSAFVVSKEHIDALVSAAYFGPQHRAVGRLGWHERWDVPYPLRDIAPDDLGEMLLRENLASVRYRYDDDESMIPDDAKQFYSHTVTVEPPTAVEALKLIDCLVYQSCEHPEWKTSRALELLQELRVYFIHELPGWDEAPWEWSFSRGAA